MIVPNSLFWGEEKKMVEFLASELGISDEDFKKYFVIEHAKRSDDIVLKIGYGIYKNLTEGSQLSETERIRKRFKKGTSASLDFKLIQSLNKEVEEAKQRNAEADRIQNVFNKVRQLSSPILEKYEDDEKDNTSGFDIELYDKSIFKKYGSFFPDNFVGNGFKYRITYSPKVLFESINPNFSVERYPKLLSVFINMDKSLSDVEFHFDLTGIGWKYTEIIRQMNSLDRLIKVADAGINWQIDILDFAEQIVNELPSEVWDLAKELN